MKRSLKVLGLLVVAAMVVSALAGCASTPVMKGLVVAPAAVNLQLGGSQGLAVTEVLSDGTTANVTGNANIISSNAAVAAVNAGVVSAVGPGNATVSVSFSDGKTTQTGTVQVTVAKPGLKSIVASPVNASMALKGTQPINVTAIYSDGSTADITGKAAFNTYDSALVPVDAKGVATAKAAGSTYVLVVYEEGGKTYTATARFTVGKPTLKSMYVTPDGFAVDPKGKATLVANAIYSDGSTVNVTAKTSFNTFDSSIATVDAKGVVTGVKAGATKIYAYYTEGSTTLPVYVPFSVNKPPVTVTVTPKPATTTAKPATTATK